MGRITRQVLLRRSGQLGQITLTRPEAINALSLEMIQGIRAGLELWRYDSDVSVVALDGEGPRGFCAGGDIRFVRTMGLTDPPQVHNLWWEEYELDLAI